MKLVRQLMKDMAQNMVTANPGDTVYSALEKMAKHNIGALPVVDGQRLVGIFSERDHVRKVTLRGLDAKTTPLKSVLTDKVFYVTPDVTVMQCMALVTEKRSRHLPVIEDGKLLGVVSIGDLVKETISEQTFIIDQLERYITS